MSIGQTADHKGRNKISPMITARVAGILYLLMLPLGILGILYVPAALIVSGDIAATVSNIMDSQMLFRVSIVAALMVQLTQTFLVLALYKVLKPVGSNMAALMVVLILVAVPIAMLNEVNRFGILFVLNGGESVFSPEQVQQWVSLFIDLHEHGITIAQIFWGLWLFPMGYLVFKSDFLPKVIGILLIIGCFGYLLDSFVAMLFPEIAITFSQFTFIGELVLPLWLVIRGVNVEKWKKQALLA